MGSVISILFENLYGSERRRIMKRSGPESSNCNIPASKASKFGVASSQNSFNLDSGENECVCLDKDVGGDDISRNGSIDECPKTRGFKGINEKEVKINILSEHTLCKDTNNSFSKLNGATSSSIASEYFDIIHELHINNLPTSVLLHILQYLSINELVKRAALVCKRWNELCLDPDLWRDISFRGHLKVDDEVLERYTNFNGNVTQSLDLTDLRLITSNGVCHTLAHCGNLKKLHLLRCMQLTDQVFTAIGATCHRLVVLKADCCTALTDQGLTKVAVACPKLEQLGLNQCTRVKDAGMMAVAKSCPRLKLLNIKDCKEITDLAVEALTNGCPNLESLALSGTAVTEKGLMHLAKCKKLRILEMTQMNSVTDHSVIHIVRHCHYLRSLNVSLCHSITDKCVRYIAEHGVSMMSLYLVACKLTDHALISLAEYSKTIEKVDVGWCEEITAVGAEHISENCKTLLYLGLLRCDKIGKESSERLIALYPRVTYSTVWVECEKVMQRARMAGYVFA